MTVIGVIFLGLFLVWKALIVIGVVLIFVGCIVLAGKVMDWLG